MYLSENLIMARGINKVILIGNLGDEPAYRTTNNGTAVVNLSLCTSDTYKDANGNDVDASEWHRLVIWGKGADVARQYMHKGTKLYVEGKLQTREYTDKQNIKRYITEIVVQDFQMLSKKDGATTQAQAPASQANGTQQGYNGQGNVYGNNANNAPYGNNGYQPQPQAQQGFNQAPQVAQNNGYRPQPQQNVYNQQQSQIQQNFNNAVKANNELNDATLPF